MKTELLTIRSGVLADAAAIREFAIVELGRAQSLHRLQEILERYPSVLAVDDGRLCGFVFGVAMSPDIIQGANLLIAESYRNQGLGSRLVHRFEEVASANYQAIILANSNLWPMAHGEKRSSVPLYKRLGYREIYSTPETTVIIKELAQNR